MQAIKYGMKSILRTPIKTLLFALLLAVISALTAVSFSVFHAVRGYISDCDSYYHTIAELEYIGRDYPDNNVYDGAMHAFLEENAEEISSLIAMDGVVSFEPERQALCYTPLAHRMDEDVYDPDIAVLDICVIAYDPLQNAYNVTVNDALYSRTKVKGKLILARCTDDSAELRPGSSYIVTGRFFKGVTVNPWFLIGPTPFADGGENRELDCIKERVGGESTEDYYRLAKFLGEVNDSFRVTYTSALGDLFPFHQQVLSLTSGRMFTEEEYRAKAHKAVISERAAGLIGAKVGDTVDFRILVSNGDLFDGSALRTADSGEYEIIGIFAEHENYPYRVFLPDANAVSDEAVPVNGYTIGHFRLRNGAAAEFDAAARELTKLGFRFSIYDQGYAAATEPMQQLMLISVIFLAVCLLLAAAALVLHSSLFVSRQREAALTMRALGTGRAQVFVYFLSAALVLAVIAAAVGCAVGRLLEGRVIGLMQRFASQYAEQDMRFSDSRLALLRTLEFDPKIPLSVYLAAGGVIVAGSAALTAAAAAFCLKEKHNKKRSARRAPLITRGRTSKLSGFFKYAMLSMRRGVIRAAAVMLMGAAAAVFFGYLVYSLEGYGAQLESYRANAEISGFATDHTGRRIDGLVINGAAIDALIKEDVVSDPAMASLLGHIRPIGVVRTCGGEEKEAQCSIPTSEFAYETLFDRIWHDSEWTAASSVSRNSIFHFSQEKDIRWLEGFDETLFVGNGYYAALPDSVMAEYGISLGDTVRFEYAYYKGDGSIYNGKIYDHDMLINFIDLQVVGAYTSVAGDRTVFSPLHIFYPDDVPYKAYGGDMIFLSLFGNACGNILTPGYYGFEYKNGIAVSMLIDIEAMLQKVDGVGWYRENLEFDGVVPFDLTGEGEKLDYMEAMSRFAVNRGSNYSSFTFRLPEVSRLDALRAALDEAGFTWFGSGDRTKNYAVIEDEVYVSTTHTMERQIQYVTALYYALFIMAGVIGAVLAWLLAASRRREIAVQRALGTPPIRIAANFFAEQLLLMTVGLAIGLCVTRLIRGGLNAAQLALPAAFLAVWCVSALCCLSVSLKKRSYAALTEPE